MYTQDEIAELIEEETRPRPRVRFRFRTQWAWRAPLPSPRSRPPTPPICIRTKNVRLVVAIRKAQWRAMREYGYSVRKISRAFLVHPREIRKALKENDEDRQTPANVVNSGE